MTIDETIKKENEIIAEFQKIVKLWNTSISIDTHIINDTEYTTEEIRDYLKRHSLENGSCSPTIGSEFLFKRIVMGKTKKRYAIINRDSNIE